MSGFYRTYSTPSGTKLEWLPDQPVDPDQVHYRELFPNGVPLRGELTPAQQAWLDGRR